eukprot:TRINITY_DN1986_c0_g1_i1.p1 TRINITY_DN1986_c0_g1~~TRINITY_DN1986_c0_g1_i1.p1  ORF type:complete len:311 (-),score=67.62 TRINITY_DN1986_c0_g1_i1:713-1645(-)
MQRHGPMKTTTDHEATPDHGPRQPAMQLTPQLLGGFAGCIVLTSLMLYVVLPSPGQLSIGQLALVQVYVCMLSLYLVLKFLLPPSVPASTPATDVEMADDAQPAAPVDQWSVVRGHLEQILPSGLKFGAIMLMYMYTSVTGIWAAEKEYDRDTFICLLMLCGLAGFLTIKKTKTPHIVNRDQTEEWKGWMQVIFLAYHYFGAGTEVYNLVRVLIAAYVWMTGFGHFVYFSSTGKYDFVRVMRTLLRLNFLIFFTCLATNNEYMLYYICAMHTFWFFCLLSHDVYRKRTQQKRERHQSKVDWNISAYHRSL